MVEVRNEVCPMGAYNSVPRPSSVEQTVILKLGEQQPLLTEKDLRHIRIMTLALRITRNRSEARQYATSERYLRSMAAVAIRYSTELTQAAQYGQLSPVYETADWLGKAREADDGRAPYTEYNEAWYLARHMEQLFPWLRPSIEPDEQA